MPPAAPAAEASWVPELAQVEGAFDLALALDVLEHSADPEGLLADLASRLRPGGTALVSVPNVAHWSMRASLLAGRFDYAERGILDRTHLRFFTRATFLDLLAGVGLRVEETGEAVVPLELLLPEAVHESAPWGLLRVVRRAAAKALPGLFAYQLLARVTR